MEKENWLKRAFQATVFAFKRVFHWIRRAFSPKEKWKGTAYAPIETPTRRVVRAFFARKSAVVALGLLVALFLFSFIAPRFVPLDIHFTDSLAQNVPPCSTLRSVPKGLKGQAAFIDGFSDFTIGVSSEGKLFVWGNTKNSLTKTDLKDVPDAVRDEGVAFAAAGKDHIVAVTKTGKLVGWGNLRSAQFGYEPVLNGIPTPSILQNGVSADDVQSLSCGYQASALVMKDGRAFVWGNVNAVKNLSAFVGGEGFREIRFTNAAAIGLTKSGELDVTGAKFSSVVGAKGRSKDLLRYLGNRKVACMATSNKCVALVTEDRELVVAGTFENGEDVLPTLEEGDYFLSLDGGARHFVGVTARGKTYAWGHDGYGQCAVAAEGDAVFAGAAQSYVCKEGRVVQSVGLKGYVMGTDGRGRDVFARLVHGGKTTLTLGSIAVCASTAIALIVGCLAGYFGGAVDTVLMRVTEIFSSVPFLPFAMLLSQIVKKYAFSEGTRTVMIMFVLGALSWTGLARMLRAQILAEREKEYVVGARALGVREGRIAFSHVLPNVLSVVLVSTTLDFAGCLLTESSLSYLGFGVQPPRPTWGNMLTGSNNSTVIRYYWWQWLFPALFLCVAVVCINVVGDALRDAVDPKKGER